jgi:hypothetical protein
MGEKLPNLVTLLPRVKKVDFKRFFFAETFEKSVRSRRSMKIAAIQGCQIFLGTKYQNGGLPDFSWYKIPKRGAAIFLPKRGSLYPKTAKYSKRLQNVPIITNKSCSGFPYL